jgi:hypothetical protein
MPNGAARINLPVEVLALVPLPGATCDRFWFFGMVDRHARLD